MEPLSSPSNPPPTPQPTPSSVVQSTRRYWNSEFVHFACRPVESYETDLPCSQWPFLLLLVGLQSHSHPSVTLVRDLMWTPFSSVVCPSISPHCNRRTLLRLRKVLGEELARNIGNSKPWNKTWHWFNQHLIPPSEAASNLYQQTVKLASQPVNSRGANYQLVHSMLVNWPHQLIKFNFIQSTLILLVSRPTALSYYNTVVIGMILIN